VKLDITDDRLELATKGSCSVDNASMLDFSAEKATRPDVAEVQDDNFSNGTVIVAANEQR